MMFPPSTPEYEAATQPHNSLTAQHPAQVARPGSADEVATAIRRAAADGLTVVVQGSGHGAGAAVEADALLLDTSGLDAVRIDHDARTVTVGAGVAWGAVNAAAERSGLLAPAGSSPSVTVCGYTFGGGIGWLGRRYGLASSALRRVTYVDAEGRVRVAAENAQDATDREALWAFRGAGGVGIAVELELDLFPVPDLHAGYLLWPASDLAAVVGAWAAVVASGSGLGDGVASSIGVLKVPPAPNFPESLQGTTAIHLALADPDGSDGAPALLDAVRAAATPVVDSWGPADAERLAGIHLDPPTATPAWGDARWLSDPTTAVAILTAASAQDAVVMTEIRHVSSAAPARDGAMTTAPTPYLVHVVGPVTEQSSRDDVDRGIAAIRAAAGSADSGRPLGSWMEGAATVPGALPADVRARAQAAAGAVDPDGRIRRSRLLG